MRSGSTTGPGSLLSAVDLKAVTPIIRLAYEGVDHRPAWSEMVEQVRRLFRGHDSALVRTPLRSHASPIFVSAGFDPALVKLFHANWGYPPRHEALAKAIRSGADGVILTDEIMGWQEVERTEYYDVFRRPRRVRWEISATRLQDPQVLAYLTVNRVRTQPRFGDRERALAEMMVAHVVEALRLDARLEAERRTAASLKLTVESLADAVFAIERDGGLRPLNQVAERFLVSEEITSLRPIALQQPRNPLVSVVGDVQRFERFLGGDLSGASRSATLRRTVTLPSGRRYRVDGTLRFEQGLIGCAVLQIREMPASLGIDDGTLRQRWELTRREVELVRRLIEGGTHSRTLCRDLGITIETLRTHLRHLFEKTGTSNRAELVAAVLRVARSE